MFSTAEVLAPGCACAGMRLLDDAVSILASNSFASSEKSLRVGVLLIMGSRLAATSAIVISSSATGVSSPRKSIAPAMSA